MYPCIYLLVSHRRGSLLVRVWPLDVWGELVPSKIFNPPFPVLKAGHSVSYSYICDVCMKWVGGWISFYILLKFLFGQCAMHMVFMYMYVQVDSTCTAYFSTFTTGACKPHTVSKCH